MTLEQLRIFVAVAEREHVTKAAGDLNLTQSAVSAAVSSLENRYATKLFDRVGRRIELTEAGRTFLSEARAVLARAGAAETVLADLAGLKRGSLTLAASQTVANYWLPALMHRYRGIYPGIELRLIIGNTEAVASMVHDGLADLGFVEGVIDDPVLAIKPVGDDELVLVVAPGYWQEKKAGVSSAELKALAWVVREQGSGTRAIFEAAMTELGLRLADLNIVLEMPSNEAVRTAVEDGAGAAILSKLVVGSSLKSGALFALDLALPKRQFLALRHKERYLTKAEQELYHLVEDGKIADAPSSAGR
jgi:DNA-binding transcriptional LysR family regulator